MVQTYSAPLRDMRFVLNELLDVGEIATLPGYEDATPDVIDAMIEEGAKLCENTLLPLNRPGGRGRLPLRERRGAHAPGLQGGVQDLRRCRLDRGSRCRRTTAARGLPQTISMVFDEMVCSTNLAFGVYPLLSNGAAAVIELHAMEALKQAYLPQLADGTWSGTMCLTEPHCGTDLGLIRTKAVPKGDGRYAISGTKIFISARRARPHREHRAPGAGEAAGRAARRARHQPLPGAEADAEGGRHGRACQRRLLRLHRGEDGHPRVGDLRDALRRGGGLPDRQAAQGAAVHVHDDERRPPRRRPPGLRPGRDRLPERDRLRQGPPPGARAQGRRRARRIRRPDHRPPRCAPHAAHPARHQ